MKQHLLDSGIARALGFSLAVAGVAALAGCAGVSGNSGGTASLNVNSPVQGRDLGRGGATSGGISSLERWSNASDFSVYDARQMQAQEQQQAKAQYAAK
jgi:hypothetical protein